MRMPKKKKTTKRTPNVRTVQRRTLEERTRELDDDLAKVQSLYDAMIECLAMAQETARACVSIATTVKAFEQDELKCVALVTLKSAKLGAALESSRFALFRGQSLNHDFTLRHDGPFELELVNLGREFCFMTEAICAGQVLCHGTFLRAFGDGAAGTFVRITLQRS